ncbi:MAG: hypothetical protein JOS17DRAFT_745499, partial [Linnemannia elongata]
MFGLPLNTIFFSLLPCPTFVFSIALGPTVDNRPNLSFFCPLGSRPSPAFFPVQCFPPTRLLPPFFSRTNSRYQQHPLLSLVFPSFLPFLLVVKTL